MGSLRHIKCLPETLTGKLFQSDLHNEKPPDSLITSWGSLIYWSFVHVPLANIESEVFRRNPNALIALPRKAAISWWRISMRAKLPGTRWDMVRGQNRIEWNLTEGLKGLPSLKPNIAPENGWLEYYLLVSFWDGLFSGAMLVSGRLDGEGRCWQQFQLFWWISWISQLTPNSFVFLESWDWSPIHS